MTRYPTSPSTLVNSARDPTGSSLVCSHTERRPHRMVRWPVGSRSFAVQFPAQPEGGARAGNRDACTQIGEEPENGCRGLAEAHGGRDGRSAIMLSPTGAP